MNFIACKITHKKRKKKVLPLFSFVAVRFLLFYSAEVR